MIIVAIVAADIGLIRVFGKLEDTLIVIMAYSFVPSLSLLSFALVIGTLQFLKHGKASSFSTGYLLLGGLASFLLCLDLGSQSFSYGLIVFIANHASLMPDYENHKNINITITNSYTCDCIIVFILWLPQFLMGLIGGGLATRYNLAFVQLGHDYRTGDD